MKKSISVNVMSWPVIYYGNYSALVSIYRCDGTVTLGTGGIEMGQEINTKAAQVCAYELGECLLNTSTLYPITLLWLHTKCFLGQVSLRKAFATLLLEHAKL